MGRRGLYQARRAVSWAQVATQALMSNVAKHASHCAWDGELVACATR